MKSAPEVEPVEEGLRARKRRQTGERIANAAIELFLERGFEATTVDDIARAADVSKRSFFDYFATKEDVVGAWQDEFGATLAAAVTARPRGEALTAVVEEAMSHAVRVSRTPRGIALDRLVRTTPALRERDQLKYMKLEQVLSDALLARVDGDAASLRARLLAAVVIACLRVAGEESQTRRRFRDEDEANAFTRETFRTLWGTLHALGTEARPETSRKQRKK